MTKIEIPIEFNGHNYTNQYAFKAGYDSRQKEIDALKEQNLALVSKLDKASCLSLKTIELHREIEAHKWKCICAIKLKNILSETLKELE